MDPQRAELLRNAVSFLSDPQSQSSPVVQRVQFLESRGLTNPEIYQAFAMAYHQQHGGPPSMHSGPFPGYGVSSTSQPWDWRDYFITAILSGTAMLGAYSLAQKYLFPHLTPPTLTAYEADKEALTAQFDAAEVLLKEMQASTVDMHNQLEAQCLRVDAVVDNLNQAVEEMRSGEQEVRDEMREIRTEVNNMQQMLPKMLDRVKDAQSASYAELQQELKSVKTLLQTSRGGSNGADSIQTPGSSALPSTVGAGPPRKPTIPAWQLAAPSSSSSISLDGKDGVNGSSTE